MAGDFEGEILQVMEVTGLNLEDRDMVFRALTNSDRRADLVVNEFFNDPDGFRSKYSSTWDEGMFSADRDGTKNNTGVSFHVDAPDQTQDQVIHGVEPNGARGSGAPSRPPSRTTDRSPLGRLADWTVPDASDAPRSQAQEEEEMQRALRQSAEEAGISMPEQQSGVIPSTLEPHFGPANRDEYDADKWALVPSGANETPAETQPAPPLRKREAQAPAFLVQGLSTGGDHRLGAFLTILHEIPLARNQLLLSGNVAASYGHNSQWWKGQEIVSPQVLSQLQTGELGWEESPEEKGFEEEMHRLMAFLDSTERSYGTVSVLANMIPAAWTGIEKRFYENFAARNPQEIGTFYTQAVVTKAQGDGDDDEEQREHFGVLESSNSLQDFNDIKTLYELVDNVMWADILGWGETADTARMAMFRDMGEVLAINMAGVGPPESIEIPEELYPERWLASRKEEAFRIQLGLRRTRDAAQAVEEAKAKLHEFQNEETGEIVDKRLLASKADECFRAYSDYLDGRGRFRVMQELGSREYPEYRAAPSHLTEDEENLQKKFKEASDFTQRLLADLQNRVQELDGELEKIRAKQRFLGRLLTEPNKPGRPKPMKCNKYLLQGVMTATDVVYVCRRRPELIELGDAPTRDQWWRLAYVPEDTAQPVKTETLEYDQVHERIWKDTKTPLLVYATEQAICADPVPLPSSLELFVKADNKAFRQELSQETSEPSPEPSMEATGNMDLTSPSKRKHRADSPDSMASNRASAGSDDGRDFKQGGQAPPPLPERHPASTENTSADLTPNTQMGGGLETQQTSPLGSPEEVKAPEMQERQQMPSGELKGFLTGERPEQKQPDDENHDMNMA